MMDISQHARFAEWFECRRGPRDVKAEAALLAVADAYDEAIEADTLSPKNLLCIVEGARDPRALVWDSSSELLGKLSARWKSAADAITTMFQSRRAHVRFAAICSLRSDTPVDITDPVLKGGLRDKSARVRWKAADRANRLDRRNLVPEIAEALTAETNDKTRRSIELDFRMLRDGYWVRPAPAGNVSITVRLPNGIMGISRSADELHTRGIEAILAELKR